MAVKIELMKDFSNMESLDQSGFEGFLTVLCLKKSGCQEVTDGPGVYLVLYAQNDPPSFAQKSSGGHFKGKDPTKTDVAELAKKWVDGAKVAYIGKAESLKKRLTQYMQFGQGSPVAHWGGRYIWQLKNPDDLRICWKATPNPRNVEKRLLRGFKEKHGGKLPYANLRS